MMLQSCYNETVYYDKATAKLIAQKHQPGEIPPPPSPDIYLKFNSDSVGKGLPLNFYNLYRKGGYDENDFAEFLYKIMNQKLIPKSCTSYNLECYKLDAMISKFYKQNGIDGVLKKYCKKENRFYFKNQNLLSKDEIHTIGYYCYLNKYSLSFDDYSGMYSIQNSHF